MIFRQADVEHVMMLRLLVSSEARHNQSEHVDEDDSSSTSTLSFLQDGNLKVIKS